MNKDELDEGAAATSGEGTDKRRGARVVYDHVTKQYGSFYALAPISLEIESGEFFSIIGPSGSGKTTLLGVTAGFIPAPEGAIPVDGRGFVGISPFHRNIGVGVPNYSLFSPMTFAQNIRVPPRVWEI